MLIHVTMEMTQHKMQVADLIYSIFHVHTLASSGLVPTPDRSMQLQ